MRDVTFEVCQDRITAIVGPTGSGKTTLVALLSRFYSPRSGVILIDGEDIQEYDLQELRQSIGVVEQEIHLFAGTIYQNIAYGKRGATKEEVEEAAEAMMCDEFINEFPLKLDTRIGTGGVQLSVGQKQRVALARAVIRDPRILILDEPTSALDARAESMIQAALIEAARGRTVLLITHQLSTLSIADRILVLVDGRIVEEGTLQELEETGSYFGKYYLRATEVR